MKTLAKHVSRVGPLSVRDAIGWIYRAASTLAPMHAKGVAHGAISGRALLIEAAVCTSDGELLDSYDASANSLYFSTVRTEGGGPSLRDDVWALTVLLYFALSARFPFPKGLNAAKRGKGWVGAQPIGMHRSELIEMQPFFEALLRPGEWGADSAMDLIGILNEFSPVVTTLGPLTWRDVAPIESLAPPGSAPIVRQNERRSSRPAPSDPPPPQGRPGRFEAATSALPPKLSVDDQGDPAGKSTARGAAWPDDREVKTGDTERPPALSHGEDPTSDDPAPSDGEHDRLAAVSQPPSAPPTRSVQPGAAGQRGADGRALVRTVSIVVLALAVGAIAYMLYERGFGKRTATPATATPSGTSAAPTATSLGARAPTQSASPSNKPGPTPPSGSSNACLLQSLPSDAFDDSPPNLGFICAGGKVNAVLDELAETLVVGSKGKTTMATKEWQGLGLYRLGLIAALRGRCCASGQPVTTPAMYATCKLREAMDRVAASISKTDDDVANAHQALGESVRCLATAGAPASFHVYDNPTNQQSARFIRVLHRVRGAK